MPWVSVLVTQTEKVQLFQRRQISKAADSRLSWVLAFDSFHIEQLVLQTDGVETSQSPVKCNNEADDVTA